MSQTEKSTPAAKTDPLQTEIDYELENHTILIYGKGTKDMPRCGFTLETIEFFSKFGYPFEVLNVLGNDLKRARLAEMTNWPTLPKVFIDGTFYGDTDILGPLAESGELTGILKNAFDGEEPATKDVIQLH